MLEEFLRHREEIRIVQGLRLLQREEEMLQLQRLTEDQQQGQQ